MFEIIEKNIPNRTQSKNGKLKKKPLWMNSRALDKVRRKNTAFKKYLNSREDLDYSENCKQRNKARKATRQAIKDFEKLIAKEAKRNPKAFHKYVNSKTKVRSGISELETNDGLVTRKIRSPQHILHQCLYQRGFDRNPSMCYTPSQPSFKKCDTK